MKQRRQAGSRQSSVSSAVLSGLWFGTLLALAAGLLAGCQKHADWPAWQHFQQRFIDADGRVVDLTFGGKTTSEGQSYGLFFALVADDRPRFDSILAWTTTHLAGDRLGDQLPAWLWNRGPNGLFGVQDENSASDADLWLAYTLIEAGRLWKAPTYNDVGQRLLARIALREVVRPASGAALLLPAPLGFVLDDGRFRVNPSYLPGFIFERLAAIDSQGPWRDIWTTYSRQWGNWFPLGMAADTLIVDGNGRRVLSAGPAVGSYDAVRVYLWAGMTEPTDGDLIHTLAGYAGLTRLLGDPPAKVDVDRGEPIGGDRSPIGYSGAVLPFLHAFGDQTLMESMERRLMWYRLRSRVFDRSSYYDEALILFGEGWREKRYSFDQEGRLRPAWAALENGP